MIDRDPLYKPGIGNIVLMYSMMGAPEKAMSIIDRVRPFLKDDPTLARSEASIFNITGRPGESLPLTRFAYERTPTDSNAYTSLAIGLMQSNQFEQLAEINNPFPHFKIYALLHLDRYEEASILAYQWANQGQNPGILFETLASAGKFRELIDYLEQRWPDLIALETAFPATFGFGFGLMISVAHAYRETGNQSRFEQAMSIIKNTQEQQRLAGADFFLFHASRAEYWLLAGDDEQALDSLQIYVDKGGLATPLMSDSFPLFESLEGKPRYEAIQKQMIEHLNAERARLNLAPLALDRAL